jgi:DNA polymerase
VEAVVVGNAARDILRQQLRTEALLGLKSVPIPLPRPRDEINAERLATLDRTQVKECRKCRLCEGRTQTVFGQGHAAARLVFVGEGPGYEEDKQGLAFVGPAGQLLTKMIAAMGLTRNDVYICNVVKCRPPENRTPFADEMLACSPYLHEQLSIIQPEIIVALGAPAAKTLLNTADSVGKLRGRFHEYHPPESVGEGRPIPVMPTYHPAYLLRTPEDKGKVWADLQMVMSRLGLKPPQAR